MVRLLAIFGLFLATLSVAPVAMAGTVNLKNCGDKQIWAKAFNSNDGIMLIPSAEGCIKPNAIRKLTCATGKCRITVRYGICDPFEPTQYGTHSGNAIYYLPGAGGFVASGTHDCNVQ